MFVEVGTLASEGTVIVTAREAGQVLRIGGTTHTATEFDEQMHITGTGLVELGLGYWDLLTIVADADYEGAGFYGGMPSEMYADTVTFQRRDTEDSPWITLADGVDPSTTITDPVPALGAPEYRAISHTTLPSSATGPVTVVPLPRGLWPVFLNTGPGFNDVVALYDNTQYSPNTERGKTRHRRAGRSHPVTKWGAHRDHTYTLTATVSPDSPGSSVADVQALEDEPYVACYRDVLGHKHFVTVDNISASAERDGRWTVTVPMTREDVDEEAELAGGGA